MPITNDLVLESPDERLNVRLLLPGMVPSPEGHLWASLQIEDDGDGACVLCGVSDVPAFAPHLA